MNITMITFKKTVQTAPYESETLELTASVDEHESHMDCITDLMSAVHMHLDRDFSPRVERINNLTEVVEAIKESQKELGKDKLVVPTDAPILNEKQVEAVKKDVPVKPSKEEKAQIKADAKAKKDAEKEEAKKLKAEEKAKKDYLKSVVNYDRSINNHKKAFIDIVIGLEPDYKAKIMPLVKETSINLEGTPMLDKKSGEVLNEFAIAVKSGLGL